MSIKVQQYPATAQNYRLSGAVSWLILPSVLLSDTLQIHCESLYNVAISLLDPDTR